MFDMNVNTKIDDMENSLQERSHGVMVSTLDFESSDPSSNLGGTLILYYIQFFNFF